MLKYERNGLVYEYEPNDLPPAAIAYLLQYGWAQSLQDCIAGREKRVREELLEENPDMAPDEVAAAVKEDIHGTMMKRMDAITAGTIGNREPREQKDSLESIARDMVRKAYKAKGVKATKEMIAQKAAELLEKKRDAVQAEKDRRDAAGVDVEI